MLPFVVPCLNPRPYCRRLAFAQKAPGLFIFLGSNKPGVNAAAAPVNHSPLFEVDEGVLPLGVRVIANLAVDYLTQK